MPAPLIKPGQTYEGLFWSLVHKTEDGCWEFLRRNNKDGYGQFSAGPDGGFLAHRYAWTVTNGPIPDDLYVLHTCDNPPCVNPSHLYLGTKQDNSRDCWIRGRGVTPFVKGHKYTLRGERSPTSKLSDEQREEIILMRGEHPKVLAKRYGVTVGTITYAWRTYRKEDRIRMYPKFIKRARFLQRRLGTRTVTGTVAAVLERLYEREKAGDYLQMLAEVRR